MCRMAALPPTTRAAGSGHPPIAIQERTNDPQPEPDARVVDDKMAEARERAGRIEKEAGRTPDRAEDAAIDTEDKAE
jgi:hypothetical protein